MSDTREAFEKWGRTRQGRAYNNVVEAAWDAWQASRKVALQEAASVASVEFGYLKVAQTIAALMER